MQNCALVVVVQYFKMLNLSIKLLCSITCFGCLKVVWLYNLYEGMDALRLILVSVMMCCILNWHRVAVLNWKLFWVYSLFNFIFLLKIPLFCLVPENHPTMCCFSHLSKTMTDLTGPAFWVQQEIVDGSFCDSTLILFGSSFWHSEANISEESLFCLTALSDDQ